MNIVEAIDQLKELRADRESLPILRRAFFANYQDQDKCDELRDKIGKVVGGKDNENNS